MAPAGGLPIKKIAGATGETMIGCCAVPNADRTSMLCVPGMTLSGICALIWNGDAASTVAGVPSISTVVGVVDPYRPGPKIDIMPPGATPLVKLAAFTTLSEEKLRSCGATTRLN